MASKKSKLSKKRQRFVDEYLIDFNATQAAIRAGYSEKGASVTGSRLLADANISAAVDEGRKILNEKTQLSAERVRTELARLAFFDPRRLYREDGTLKDPSEWDEDTAAAVAALDISTFTRDGGDDLEILKKIKFWDKTRALEMVGRHLAMFTDNVNIGATDDLAAKLARAKERIRGRAGTGKKS